MLSQNGWWMTEMYFELIVVFMLRQAAEMWTLSEYIAIHYDVRVIAMTDPSRKLNETRCCGRV